MVNKRVEIAVNEQIKREEHSSRLYLAMASWCEVTGFPGAAAFLYAQAEEERIHMLKFVHYLNDRNGHALMSALDMPNPEYKSLKDVFEQVMKHEEYITASINELYGVSFEEKDFTTGNFLQWFINEQIEEESTMRGILDKLNLAGDGQSGGLFHIDKELTIMANTRTSTSTTAQ
jgi:ferritin